MHELEMDAAAMRQIGYAVVDRLVEWQTTLAERPVWNGASRSELEKIIPRDAPALGVHAEGVGDLLDFLFRDVIPRGARTDHPRFFAFVPGNGTWPAALGDLIAATTNVFQGTWLASAGVSQLELRVLQWFRDWIGLPDSAGGLLVSGGSVANLTALACARQLRFNGHDDRARIYMSRETHSSIARAARVLGFRDHQIRMIDVDDAQRINIDALRNAVLSDRTDGFEPLFVTGNAGTTSTGSIDPLSDLAALCREHNLWFHVDGAYGGFATLTERGRTLLSGIELADSVTLDPHKWLYQPFEAGCLLLRDQRLLRRAFHVMPDYLRDTAVADSDDTSTEVNFAERGVQLTRYARALKIWMSLNFFGVDAFRATIDRCLDLTTEAQYYIETSQNLELLTPARLGIVCFRRRQGASPADIDAMNELLVRRLMESGMGMISSTRVNGAYALRLCILGYRTTREDVERVLTWLDTADTASRSEMYRI